MTNILIVMFLDDFNLTKKDSYYLFGIILFTLILISYYILFNMNLGIYCSDVYVYLLNAVYFSGTNINSSQTIYLSPVICFLTSLLFKAGITDKLAIFIITGLITFTGNIAFYLLLKQKFTSLMSVCGVILYSTFAINLTWLSNGTIDLPAVAITIWIVLFTVISMKNPKYYMLIIPMFIIGFFTRYTIVLILPVLGLYYLYSKGFTLKRTDFKYILIGGLLGIIIALIILIPINYMSNGYFGVTGQISSGISGSKGSTSDLAYNTNTAYYLINFLNFISSFKVTFANRTPVLENFTPNSIIITLILLTGAILWIRKSEFNLKKESISGIVLLIISLATFNHISSFITIILTVLSLFLIGKDSENKENWTMIAWILTYLIFFSYFNIKVNRYIIPAIPPLIYLILSSIDLINTEFPINKKIIPIALIILFCLQGFMFTFAFEDTNDYNSPEAMSDYIISEIPDYANHTIGVYNMRYYHWYLGKNITGIESNNQSKIESGNISYYLSDIKQNNLSNFTEIKNINNLYLYKRS